MFDTGRVRPLCSRRLRGASGLREAGIGTGCLVGCRAAVGRGPGGVGGRGCRRGRRAGRGASVDGASVGGPVSDRAARRAGGPVAPAACRVRIRSPDAVEVAVAEMRREHPRWGSRRIRLELLRRPGRGSGAGRCRRSATIDRILHPAGAAAGPAAEAAAGVVSCGSSGRGRCSCGASTSSAGSSWSNPVTGELREAKVVTGVDDHSRFCVMAEVVERATGRAVCLAFAAGAGPVRGAGGGDHRQRQAVHRPVRPYGRAGRCCSTRSAAATGSPTG